MSIRLLELLEKPESGLMGLRFLEASPLLSPRELREECPVPEPVAEQIGRNRETIRRIIRGEDPRLLAVVGPCSLHDPAAALEYAQRLRGLADRLPHQLFVVMRAYVDKPRSTVGWRGLVPDPYLSGSGDIEQGLRTARALLLDIADTGLPLAVEILDQSLPQYLGDLVSWATVGARTSESQTHRDLASSLAMPVGFKNSTDGNVRIAVDAMVATRRPRHIIAVDQDGRCCRVKTAGNTDTHIVLRGGRSRPNYSRRDLQRAEMLLSEAGLRPSIVVDCSHGNSVKQAARQRTVLDSVLGCRLKGIKSLVGFMLESNLHAGRQDIGSGRLRYGVSVTDECIGWTETEELLTTADEILGSGPGDLKKESA